MCDNIRMYTSLAIFLVADERELNDPERIRRLDKARNSGTRTAAVLTTGAGLVCLALGAAGIWLKLTSASAPPDGWILAGTGLFFGLVLVFMAASFYKELSVSPLGGYLKTPQRYEFVKGRLTGASYLSDGNRRGAKMLVKGEFGEGGLFFEQFDPKAWSDAVAERGEEGLKPGDDRYGQKRLRARLPVEVWVLPKIGAKGGAALAGIPAETAARLTRKGQG